MKNQNYQFLQAKGKVAYNMTNDYMFRVVLQKNEEALRGLVASVMHMHISEVESVTIENPIKLGESISDKEYRLDLYVVLNDKKSVNLEMQVKNYLDWANRSLAYLCRSYDNLTHGGLYSDITPVYHISFLDFTLFEDHPEFFATYQMRNAKDNYLYNSNFTLHVVELNHTELATDDDKAYGIDTWARLFKAKTWEEIKMIAKNNPSINSTAESIYLSNADRFIRKQCRDREDFYREQEAIAEKDSALAEKDSTIAEKDSALAEKDSALAEKDSALAEKDSTIAKKDFALAEKDSTIAEKDSALAEKDSALAEKDSEIAEKDSTIAEKDEIIRKYIEKYGEL